MCSACPDCTWCLFKTCSFLLGTAIFENQICSYVELLIWVRRKSSLSRYLLGWNLFLTQEKQLRILGSCIQSLIPNFFMKHLLLVNCLMQNSQTGRALQLSQWISCEESFPAHPGANKYPVRRNILWGMIPAHPGVAELPVEGIRACPSPTWGTLGCVTVIYQGWAQPQRLCSPDRAKPQSHTCFWESQTLVSSEITRNHHLISCATAEDVGISLEFKMSE